MHVTGDALRDGKDRNVIAQQLRPHYIQVLEGKCNQFWVKGPDITIHHTEFALHSPGIGGHLGELTAFMQRKHTLPGSP